jgi:DNA-binding transcriptional regulator YdaS (Cro superfamily)
MIQDELAKTAAALCARIESAYKFECEAGPLKNCVEWQELRRILSSHQVNDAPDLADDPPPQSR